jgi:ATP-dependent DNA helicase RecG
MISEELSALASGGESEQVEFKRSTGQRTEAARTVCAMLNTRGGFVLFGVEDAGVIRGQEVSAATLASVVHEVSRIDPRPLISPEVIPVDERHAVIVLRVPQAFGTVHTMDGRPYVRVGPTSVVMSQEDYRRRLLELMHPISRWETQRAHGVTVEDLDRDVIFTTIEAGIANGRVSDPGTRDVKALLRGFGLLDGEHLLNAAVVLFGRGDRLLPFYPQRSRASTSPSFETIVRSSATCSKFLSKRTASFG